VPANVLSTNVTDGMMADTVEGTAVTIGVSGETVTVNGAIVEQADILASNGVIHVIDTVLLPGSPVPTPVPTETSASAARFAGATLVAAGMFVATALF
jgi:hypothetical protein